MDFAWIKKLNPYIVSMIVVLFTGYFKIILNQFFEVDSPMLLFFTAVAFSSWYGGFFQGVIANFLSIIFIMIYFWPNHPVTFHVWAIRFGLFTIECLAIAAICSSWRKAKEKENLVAENLLVAEKLRASERFLDSIIDNIPNMIFVKDAKDLRFVRMNKAGEKLLGIGSEELIGKNDYDLFPQEQAEFFVGKDRAVFRTNEVLDIPEEPIETKNGTRYLHTKKIPLKDQFGASQYLVGISEDITIEKETEKQKIDLLKSEAALIESEKSADRLASLALENAQLYRQAKESSRAKSAFLANISHEIRTPLGAMLGYAELVLGSDSLPAEQSDYISRIVRNGRQLLHIVDEVLDLSKAESDRIQIEKLPCSLAKIIDDVMSLLQIKAQEKGLHLNVKKDADLPSRIITDPVRVRQILINIIGNAIKFTEKGQIDVSVHFTKIEIAQDANSQRGYLDVLIQDMGIGIDSEQANRLFEPFVQADESMTRKYGGTGLGLFLSRRLAKLLGGDVTLVRSVPGKGSEFKVRIETEVDLRAEKTIVPTYVESLKSGAFTVPQFDAGKVLIVDDSPDNQTIVAAFLTSAHISVDVADNGADGVTKAQTERYDVILMDIQMPVMDGFEAIRQLRNFGYDGKVIALTAHGMKGDRERCLESGFDDYLCKPITRETLIEGVSKYILDGKRFV